MLFSTMFISHGQYLIYGHQYKANNFKFWQNSQPQKMVNYFPFVRG